ncbi:MAG: GntR family transcriptional regulator [Bacillota bacterium]
MWIHVDPSSGVPIYLQIVEQMRQAAATGLLASGEQLPSVRELALSLTVNPNTVARAYQELERDGVIAVVRGVGTFVSDSPPKLSEKERYDRIFKGAKQLAAQAYSLRFSAGEFTKTVRDAAREVYQSELQENSGEIDA